ncbi:MAG: hypothetical protein PSV17_13595 [Methylotenera sp.]|uniref:hypothetical protein n=1 Tax=Methylotenera sp. TaxID=2051956 RepID=UPI0024894270|nr:hypothetical protein [Methylotenera sp.]MDI1310448.1 hypothetical protein [Methylotenera sp.]
MQSKIRGQLGGNGGMSCKLTSIVTGNRRDMRLEWPHQRYHRSTYFVCGFTRYSLDQSSLALNRADDCHFMVLANI